MITPKFPPDIGGVAQATSRISQGLKSQEIEVQVCVPSEESSVCVNKEVQRVSYSELLEPDFWLNAGPFDLIHAFYPSTTAEIALTAKKTLHSPLILSCRGNDIDRDIWFQDGFNTLLEHLKEADMITTVTSDLKRKVMALGIPSHKVKYIANSVDTDLFTPLAKETSLRTTLKPKAILLGLIGEIRHKKGWPLILLAFKALQSQDTNLYLCILGKVREGKDQVLLDIFLKQNPELASSILYLGEQPRNTLPRHYQDFDIVLLPSYQEGMSNTLLEAMASERAVISSNVGGFPDVLTHEYNGLMIPSYELKPLIQALEKLIRSKTLRNQLGSAARKTIIKGFLPEHELAHYQTIYQNLGIPH